MSQEVAFQKVSPEEFFSTEFQDLSLEEQRTHLGEGLKSGRHPYTKIFRNKKKAKKAKEMLLHGFTLHEVARFYDIHHTSVLSFKRRCEKEGTVFPPYVRDSQRGPDFSKIKIPSRKRHIVIEFGITIQRQAYTEDGSALNGGKSYSEYVKENGEKTKSVRQQMLDKAKKTIDELHKWREDNGIIWKNDYDTSVY